MAASMGRLSAFAGDEIVMNEKCIFFMMHAIVRRNMEANKQDLLNYVDTMTSCEDRLRKFSLIVQGYNRNHRRMVKTQGFWLRLLMYKLVDEIVVPTKKSVSLQIMKLKYHE